MPQCLNCTKHHVRCDYMEGAPSDMPDRSSSSPNHEPLWKPEIDDAVEQWQISGEFPFPWLPMSACPQPQLYSKTELRLMYHLSATCDEMTQRGNAKMTLWAETFPKFMSVASSHTFAMHALLAFSATHLAWVTRSREIKNLAFHHSGAALKGLHVAIGCFSKDNADAIYMSSLLLSWQATDWRGWSSLVDGIKAVVNAMQPWFHESVFAEMITQHWIQANSIHDRAKQASAGSPDNRQSILAEIMGHLEHLWPFLSDYEHESKWIEQLKEYIERLRSSNYPLSAEEQFSHLYTLRKWLFWVPTTLPQEKFPAGPVQTLLAYFYATALALEPLYSDVGAALCADLALAPLEEVIRLAGTPPGASDVISVWNSNVIAFDFPRQVAISYRNRRAWQPHDEQSVDFLDTANYELVEWNMELENRIADSTHTASNSPAFAQSSLYMIAPPASPFLEVPLTATDYSQYYNFVTPLHSPSFLAAERDYMVAEPAYMMASPLNSEFVAPMTVWTCCS